MRASSLTYYSLLSIVPVLAMAFGIAKGFGLDKVIEKHLMEMAATGTFPEEVIRNVISFSQTLLKKTKGGVIAGAGFLMLFWSVLSILQRIEESFNEIWEVERGRTFFRKATDYLAIIVFAPMLVVVSGGAAVIVTSQVGLIAKHIGFLGPLGTVIMVALKLLPYVSIWTMLCLTYLIIPNTRVRPRSAILAGVLTGTIYQLIQFVFIKFQLGVANYNAIYGGFAALPLFIVWIQLSWAMIFFGAEIAVADEHYRTFSFHPDYSSLSISSTRLLVLRILHLIVGRFTRGEPALTARQISESLEIPLRLVKSLLGNLITAGLVAETVHDGRREPAYQAGRATEDLRVRVAIDAFEQLGRTPPAAAADGQADRVALIYRNVCSALEKMPENLLLKDV